MTREELFQLMKGTIIVSCQATPGEPLYDPVADESVNVEEQVSFELGVREFWASLNEEEQHLLQLKMNGMTMQDIAAELGLKSHSAVVKRLQKLKMKYDTM